MVTPKHLSRVFLVIAACGLGIGCQPAFNIESPTPGAVEEGAVDFVVTWDGTMDSSGFAATLNGEDVTDQFVVSASGATASFAPLPGKKLFSVVMPEAPLLGGNASILFTATSELNTDTFIGGLLAFESESSFFPLPIAIPGLDPGLGLTEMFADMLAMMGTFPKGSDTMPVSPMLPFLFGAFPQMLTFDTHPTIPNALSIEPVQIGLDIPFDPGAEGAICGFGFDVDGFIVPANEALPGNVHAVASMDMKGLSLSLVQSGECAEVFSSPPDALIMSLNYTATIQDNTPPVVTLDSPEAGAVFNVTEIEVSGTATDDSRVTPTVTVNGVEVDVDPETGVFTGLVPLAVARQEVAIDVVATDGASNTANVSRAVVYDPVPPELVLTEPEDLLSVTTPSVTVSGTASDDLADPPTVTINGDPVDVDPSTGAFSDIAVLSPGENVIEVSASDGANELCETRTVIFEVTELTLVVTLPDVGTVTSENSILVEGYAADETGLPPAVTINGDPVTVDPVDFTFSEVVDLDNGENTLVVFADSGFTTAEVQRTVTCDTVLPVLVIDDPVDGSLVNTSPLTVSGTATDNLGNPEVTVNGVTAVVDPGTGAFTAEVDLVAGPNAITVVCSDAANTIEDGRTVTFDDLPPTLMVLYPFNGFFTSNDTVLVVGFAMDDQADPPAVEVNGESVTLDPLLYSFGHEIALDPGTNVIEVTATDGINEEVTVITITKL